MESEQTTIKISKDLREYLRGMKLIPRETYDSVIIRIIQAINNSKEVDQDGK